jgi:hypothetical protein
MLIRHAEKPVGSGTPYGITSNGKRDSESLTVLGWQRAGALVELFAPARGSVRHGLVKPKALFAADPHHASKRPLETITPLAARLNLPVSQSIKNSRTKDIGHLLRGTPGPSLTAWQHQDLPSIAGHLGTVKPAVPQHWPGSRFDIVWVFTRQGDGSWAFTQVPQLLLAGDETSVIT